MYDTATSFLSVKSTFVNKLVYNRPLTAKITTKISTRSVTIVVQVIFFICEKIASGSKTDEEELLHYAKLQRIMCVLKEIIRQDEYCNYLSVGSKMRTEWEYSMFGGFNGLSLGLTIADYD